ncbi:MAG: polysaccharide biosynthesis protein [Clostridiales bacterium]|nr:polysaccharide biosynthesis protein [Clostridiales bacterium]
MENKRKSSFIRGAAILAAAGILCKIIGVLFHPLAYDILGEVGKDYYDVVFPFYSWLLIISSSGIPIAISRLVAERVSLGDKAAARKVFTKSLWLMVGIGIVTTAVLFFGAEFLAIDIAGRDASYARSFQALAPALFFVSILCAFRGYLQGIQRMMGTAVSQIVEQVIKLVFALWLARLWLPMGLEWAAAGMLVGVTISEAAALLLIYFFYLANRKSLRDTPLADPNPALQTGILKKLLLIAVPIILGASIIPITGMIDVALIKRLLSEYMTEEAAQRCFVILSTNVRSLINLPASITVALAMSLVPALTAARARADADTVQSVARMGLKLSMVIGLPCAVGLFVLGGPIIHMLFPRIPPESLELATNLMRFASITVIFISMVQTTSGALQGLGKQRLPVYFLLVGGVVKVASGYFLLRIPEVNIYGAPVSNILCYAAAGILNTVFLARAVKMEKLGWDVFGKPALASLALGVLLFFGYEVLYKLYPGSLVTVIMVVVGIIVYFVLALALRMFTPREWAYIPGGKAIARRMQRNAGKP